MKRILLCFFDGVHFSRHIKVFGSDTFEVLFQLSGAAGSHEHGGHPFLRQDPGESHLSERLTALDRFAVELLQISDEFWGQLTAVE